MKFNDTAPLLHWDGSPPPWLANFADDVTLEASVLRRPVQGKAQVLGLLRQAIPLYEFQAFTYRAEVGDGFFFESYRSSVGGTPIENMVMVHTNARGEVDSLVISHRPLGALLKFSRLVGERVGDQFGKNLFIGVDEAAVFEPAAHN
jgi:hypothetical protein